MSNKPNEPNNLNTALATWCERNGIKATELAASAGYTYMYAWRLLNGKVPVTPETLGRFVLGFGLAAAGEVLELANMTTDTLPHPEGAQAVPVVSL